MLQNIIFNTTEDNEDNTFILSNDLDQFYTHASINDYCNSKYYTEDTFNDRCTLSFSESFSLIHLNIRSFQKKLHKLDIYLENIKHNFGIIGLSETWMNDSNVALCNVHGYDGVHNYRKKKKGGGVSVLVKNCIKFSLCSELNILNDNIESIFIEIDKSLLIFSNNIIIGTIYRPPSCDIHLFMNEISLILNKLNKENKSIFIMGDYNVNLLNSDKNVQISEFIELMYSCSFLPLINRPTRIHKNSVTLIDNIL